MQTDNPLFSDTVVIRHAVRGLFIVMVIPYTPSTPSMSLATIIAADAQTDVNISQEQSSSSAEIVDIMKEANATAVRGLNDTYYEFSNDLSEISSPENNSHTGDFGIGTDIALIKPIFTAAVFYISLPLK
jgi:hypothetical protein